MPQFLIRDSDLENLYDCLKGVGETSEALLLLSKAEDEEWSRESVYNDVLILSLTDSQLDELINAVAEEEAPASLHVTLARSVKKGLAVRGGESEEDDEAESFDFVPGAPGHPLNEDGSPRQRGNFVGYCVACKENMLVEGNILTSNDERIMLQTICTECGTIINRIFANSDEYRRVGHIAYSDLPK
jgi:hypothetical protein